MNEVPSSLACWTAEQIAHTQAWVKAWAEASPALEKLRIEELRRLDVVKAIALLCGPADYHSPPRAPKPTSGLVEQQYWFQKAVGRA